ncbi:MAG TPA: hypothetical protein VFT72_11565 [Opitutaceae bacterium]|nr:hypothetical protein [Opitutaceae bacterium]
MPEQTPVPIKFPPKRETEKPLVLPKRRLRSPFEMSETAAETQKTITAIRTATRNPWGDPVDIGAEKIAELERSLKQLSTKLEERERTLQEFEARLLERERDMAETENLLRARESLLEASKAKQNSPGDSRPLSQAEEAALTKLKAEIERQQESLQGQRQAMREREAFLDESETKLFQKVQEHQEKETELEQLAEDLARRERKVREREATFDPALAASLQAEKAAAKKFNEFTE